MELSRAVGEVEEKFYDELFLHFWQTEEDLHQIVIEQLSLPADKLRELAAKYPPPASWYEETADPFSAD